MKLAEFTLWKFKRFEGRLRGFSSSSTFLTKIQRGLERYELSYDIKKNRAKLINSFDERVLFECSFKDLERYLASLGLLVERKNNRHSSSYVKMKFDL